MSRSSQPLTADALDGLPDRCRVCLFWELGLPRPDARELVREDELAGDTAVQKQAWVAGHGLEAWPPGRVVHRDGVCVAYALYGHPEAFAARLPPAPPLSDDALFLATLRVEPGYREGGVGSHLLREAVRAAIDADLKAVEAYGDRRYREHDCILPSQWLLRHGFEVRAEHPRYPVLRLEVRRTLRWAESLEAALDEVLERLPRKAPVGQRAPQRAPTSPQAPRR